MSIDLDFPVLISFGGREKDGKLNAFGLYIGGEIVHYGEYTSPGMAKTFCGLDADFGEDHIENLGTSPDKGRYCGRCLAIMEKKRNE